MRTTLDLDDELLRDATKMLVEEAVATTNPAPMTKTQVVEEGLRALLRERAGRRLASQYAGNRGGMSQAARKRTGS